MNVFSLPIEIRHTAIESGGEVVWAMRLQASPSHIAKILKLYVNVSFDGSAATSTSAWQVEKFNTAAYTGGTAITVAKKEEAQPATDVTDARFLDTGLTVGSAAVLAVYAHIGIPRSATAQAVPFILTNFANLQPGEGIQISVDNATVIGDGLTGYIEWQEDGFNF